MVAKPAWDVRDDGSSLSPEDIQSLRKLLKGTLVVKGEASEEDYQAAITRWNHVSIKEAHIVAYVADENDIATCLQFVQDHFLDVAMCSGGRHTYHGASSSTGFVIDLGNLRKVTVNKEAMTVKAQGGCIARDVETPLAKEGLTAVFGMVNETGIGGLTLGGGVGNLTGAYGLVADNLLSARMVLANGLVVTVSEHENSELFWAIRGAGPNFGIVTEFEYRAHKQENQVLWQLLLFPLSRIEEVVAQVNPMHQASLASNGRFQPTLAIATPPGSPDMMLGYRLFYNGPEGEARAIAAPLFDLGPVKILGGMMNNVDVTEIPEALKFPGFDRNAASSAILNYPLDEQLIVDVFRTFRDVVMKYGHSLLHPAKCILDHRSYAKVASVPVEATAFPSRVDIAWIIPDLVWESPSMDKAMRNEVTAITAHVRERVRAKNSTTRPTDNIFTYPNISAGGEEKAKNVYGPNLPRLQMLKKKYDPTFLFNKWFPIPPA